MNVSHSVSVVGAIKDSQQTGPEAASCSVPIGKSAKKWVSIAACPPLALGKFSFFNSSLPMPGGLYEILMRINEVLLVLQN